VALGRLAWGGESGILPAVDASLREILWTSQDRFFRKRTARPLTLPRQAGIDPKALYIGTGQNAF